MTTTISKSARFYLWPAIAANTVVMSASLGADQFEAIMLSLSLCAFATFGFLVNDLHDRVVDRENQADRLEKASSHALKAVRLAAYSFLVLGLAAALCLGKSGLLLAFFLALSLVAYTFVLRSRVLLATILAATLNTSPLFAPLLIFSGRPSGLYLTIIAAAWLIFAGREICLDIKDLPGDIVGGRKTMPSVAGARSSSYIASSLISMGAALFLVALIQSPWAAQVSAVILTATFVLPSIFVAASGGSAASILRLTVWSRTGMLFMAPALALALFGI